MIDEKARILSDRDWWQSAGDAFGLDLRGWTDRNEASFADKKTGRRLEMPGWLAERILAYESAKPKEAGGPKLGSRLTVEGVEAVVVPVALLREYRSSMTADVVHAWAADVRAMLSAAGDGHDR